MSRTVAELAGKLNSAGRTINATRNPALKAMSEHAKTGLLNEARQIVPDLNLSGVGKNGAKINVRYVIGPSNATVRATGPWQLIEYDTKPHVITSRGLRGTRKSRAAAVAAGNQLRVKPGAGPTRLKTPWGPRFSVNHPGTKGQHPWRDGVNAIKPQLPEVAAKVYRQQLARVFR